MKITRFRVTTLLVAFASPYLISQGYLVPVAVALLVILAWLHWLSMIRGRLPNALCLSTAGLVSIAALAALVGDRNDAFWLCIGGLTTYAVMLQRHNAKHVQQNWEAIPQLDDYLADHPGTSSRRGIQCAHCGADRVRNWGLESAFDNRRLHICYTCSATLYRSTWSGTQDRQEDECTSEGHRFQHDYIQRVRNEENSRYWENFSNK